MVRSSSNPDRRAAAPGLALALAATLGASAAVAQPVPNAEALVREGLAARRALRDADALAAFERAWSLAPTPMVRAQIALAEQALGRWRDADLHLREALATTDPWIARRRAALDVALAEIDAHLGLVDVVEAPEGAALAVDGTPLGALPLAAPLRWPLGPATLRVTREGFVPVERSIVVRAGVLARESVPLRREEPPPPSVAPEVVAPQVVVSPPPPATEPPRPPPRPPRRAPPRSAWGPWVLGGVGLAAGAVGAAVSLAVRADARSSLLAAGCAEGADGFECPPGVSTQARAEHARGEAASVAATVSVVAGSAALGAALVWGLVRAAQGTERAPSALTVRAGASSWDLALSF